MAWQYGSYSSAYSFGQWITSERVGINIKLLSKETKNVTLSFGSFAFSLKPEAEKFLSDLVKLLDELNVSCLEPQEENDQLFVTYDTNAPKSHVSVTFYADNQFTQEVIDKIIKFAQTVDEEGRGLQKIFDEGKSGCFDEMRKLLQQNFPRPTITWEQILEKDDVEGAYASASKESEHYEFFQKCIVEYEKNHFNLDLYNFLLARLNETLANMPSALRTLFIRQRIKLYETRLVMLKNTTPSTAFFSPVKDTQQLEEFFKKETGQTTEKLTNIATQALIADLLELSDKRTEDENKRLAYFIQYKSDQSGTLSEKLPTTNADFFLLLLDQNAQLRSENQKLQAENNSLRAENDALKQSVPDTPMMGV